MNASLAAQEHASQTSRNRSASGSVGIMQAAQQEIDELNALDAWRDAQIEVACRSAASASCQSWSMAMAAAQASFAGQDGREDQTGSIRLERSQVNEM